MSNQVELANFRYMYDRVSGIQSFDDLDFDFQKLYSKATKKLGKQERVEFVFLIRRYWKRLLASKCRVLKQKIENRKTQGQTFIEILNEVKRIKRRSEEDLDIDEYEELLDDLKKQYKIAEEKISIEKYQLKMFRLGIVIGLVGGFILGIIATLILKVFGIV